MAFTLLAATVRVLKAAVDSDPRISAFVQRLIVTGGGAKNPVLVNEINKFFQGLNIVVADEGPFAPAHHEAASMALIAARTLYHHPSSIPAVTGADRMSILGAVYSPF